MKKSHFRAIIAIIIIINLSISNVSAYSGLNFTKIFNAEKSSATVLIDPGLNLQGLYYTSTDHTTDCVFSLTAVGRTNIDVRNPRPYAVKINSPTRLCFYVKIIGVPGRYVGESLTITPSELEYINADFSYGVDKTTELESYSDNSNNLTIKFDRPVTNNDTNATALTSANFSLTNTSTSTAVAVANAVSVSGNTATINPNANLADGEYSLSILNVKDSANNTITTRTRKFIIARPVVVSINPDIPYYTSTIPNNLSVTFDKPVILASGQAITAADISKIIKFKSLNVYYDVSPLTGSISADKKTINFSLVDPILTFNSSAIFETEVVSSQLISETSGYAVNGSNVQRTVYFAPITYTLESFNSLSDDLVINLSVAMYNYSGAFSNSNGVVTFRKEGVVGNGNPLANEAVAGTFSISNGGKTYTINPDADLVEGGKYFLRFGHHVHNLAGALPIQRNAINVPITIPTLPVSSFDISANEIIFNDETLKISFDEDVYSSATKTAFTSTTSASLITLKEEDASGTDIAFTASVTNNKEFVITATSALPTGNVYLSISDGYYNAFGAKGLTNNVTFEVNAPFKPILTPKSHIHNSAPLTLNFDRAIFADTSGTEVTKSILTFKENNSSGEDVPFNAYVSSDNKKIVLDPSITLTIGDYYYIAIDNNYYDSSSAQGVAASFIFSVVATRPVDVNFVSDASSSTSSNPSFTSTVTFSEPIVLSRGRGDINSSHIPSIITFGQFISGALLPVSGSISSDKKSITFTASGFTLNTDHLSFVNSSELDSLTPGYDVLANYSFEYSANNKTGSAAFYIPIPTFSVAGETTALTDANNKINNRSSNIEITFNEPVYSDATKTAFTSTTLASLITLKENNSSGNDIPFSATISGNIITINPTADLPEGDVYLAISDGFYNDLSRFNWSTGNNQGDETIITLSVDTSAPIVTFSPTNNSIDLGGLIDSDYAITDNTNNISAVFNQAVYADTSQTVFTDLTIDNIITLKTTDASGVDIPFDATISGNIVTINPTANLAEGKVYVAFDNNYYNNYNNATPAQGLANEATYTVDATPLTVEFTLQSTPNSEHVDILATFSEEIFADSSLTPFTDSTIDSIIELRIDNFNGQILRSDATISGNVVTFGVIEPSLPNGFIYVSAGRVPTGIATYPSPFYDKAGNVVSGSEYTFTSGTFPTVSVNSPTTEGDLIFTFSEAVYSNASNAVFTSNSLNSILTLRDSSGSDVPFTASINANNNIINLNPTNNLNSGQSYYIKLNSYYFNQAGVSGISYTSTQNATTTPTTTPTPTPTPPSSGGGGGGGGGGGFYYVDGGFTSNQIVVVTQPLTEQQRVLIRNIESAIIEILEELINIYIEKIRLAGLAS